MRVRKGLEQGGERGVQLAVAYSDDMQTDFFCPGELCHGVYGTHPVGKSPVGDKYYFPLFYFLHIPCGVSCP